MPTYVSILRGINVSGQKKIKMADLAAMYEALGFSNVLTYIQSGNVVFSAPGKDAAVLGKKIAQGISKTFGFEVPVLVRSKTEMANTIKKNPFLKQQGIDATRLHVTFLPQAPEKALAKKLEATEAGSDQCRVIGSDVYLYCPGGYGKTRLSNTYIEKQLATTATTRNWNTVNVLTDMLAE